MNNLFKNKTTLEFIHDNLNDQWIIADLSNKKYKFYHKINNFNCKIYSNPQYDKFNKENKKSLT